MDFEPTSSEVADVREVYFFDIKRIKTGQKKKNKKNLILKFLSLCQFVCLCVFIMEKEWDQKQPEVSEVPDPPVGICMHCSLLR